MDRLPVGAVVLCRIGKGGRHKEDVRIADPPQQRGPGRIDDPSVIGQYRRQLGCLRDKVHLPCLVRPPDRLQELAGFFSKDLFRQGRDGNPAAPLVDEAEQGPGHGRVHDGARRSDDNLKPLSACDERPFAHVRPRHRRFIQNVVVAPILIHHTRAGPLPVHHADQLEVRLFDALRRGRRPVGSETGLHRGRREKDTDVRDVRSLAQNSAQAAYCVSKLGVMPPVGLAPAGRRRRRLPPAPAG